LWERGYLPMILPTSSVTLRTGHLGPLKQVKLAQVARSRACRRRFFGAKSKAHFQTYPVTSRH